MPRWLSSICFVSLVLTWEQLTPPPVTLYRLKVNGALVAAWTAESSTPLPTPHRYRRLVPFDVPDQATVRLLACNGPRLSNCSDDSNAYPWPTPTPTPRAATPTPPIPTPPEIL